MITIKNKKLLLTLSTFLIAFLFTGCFLFNSSPVIESDPVFTAKEGVAYTYDVEATDPNGDTLTYSLTTSLTGMTINSTTGVITWTPAVAGSFDVTVEVSDGSKSETQSFTITVEENPFASIEVLPVSMSIKAGSSQTITSVTAHYDDGTEANIALTACTYESNNSNVSVTNGVVKVASTCSATVATITVNYTEDGVTKSDTVTVIVSVVPASGG